MHPDNLIIRLSLKISYIYLKFLLLITFLGRWHHIVAKRYHQDGLLELDGTEDRVRGSTVGSLRTLNISPEMWIGGFDLKSKSPSLRGRRNENNEMETLKTGFMGEY